jgi:hypothetical protein
MLLIATLVVAPLVRVRIGVIVSMAAEGRYSVDFDAATLSNGCSVVTPTGGTIDPFGFVCPTPAMGDGFFNNCTIVLTSAGFAGFYQNTTVGAGSPTTGAQGTNVTP